MKLEKIIQNISNKATETAWNAIEKGVDLYNKIYERYPKTTNYLSTAVGTVGGDAIAKITNGERVELRDIAFTAGASAIQAYLYPKLIPLAEKITNVPKVEKAFEKIRINKPWVKAITLTALFFPINMVYWNYLSLKNNTPINWKSNLAGARAIVEASIPYTGVDYLVANKLNKRYALPVWSGAELGWNFYVALKNYVTKRILE